MLIELEKMKECFELGEKFNWDRTKILENKSIVFENFKRYVQEYIKQNNIKPTMEMIFCLLYKNKLFVEYNQEILEAMIEEGSISSDLEQIRHDYCKFCFIIKEQKGIEYCKEKNISWEEVEKSADIYVRSYIQVSDLQEDRLMEICYAICEQCNWNSKEISSKTKLFVEDVKKYAYKYITDVKKEVISKELFWFFISNPTKQIIQNYKSTIKLLMGKGKITYEQIQNPIWVEENIRNYISKFWYDLFVTFDYSRGKLKEYCEKLDISFGSVENLVHDYEEDNLSSSEREIITNKIRENADKILTDQSRKWFSGVGMNLVLDNILNSSSDSEIISIINNCDYEFSSLKYQLSNYIITQHDGSKEIRELLEKKLEVYKKYLDDIRTQKKEEQKKEQEIQKSEKELTKLPVAQQIINQFLDGDYNKIQDFCDKVQILEDEFQQCVELIKKYDQDLYDKYNSYIESKKSQRFIILFTTVKKIIEMIKTGIDNNGVKREFDLVDYYEYTKLSFDELLNIVKGKISADDYRALRMFIAKNKNDKELKKDDILYNNHTVVGVEFDKFGKVIPNTGREITTKDKENIIEYLKRKNIPITNKTYNIIFRKWLAGDLLIEEEKGKGKQ